MPAVIPDEGELELLDKTLKDALTTNEDYLLDLYVNNYTPISSSTGTDFTIASFPSYAQKTLTRSGWGAATTVSGVATSVYGTVQTFTSTGGTQTAYGYLVRGATSGKVLWAELFASPRSMGAGAVESLTVTFKGKSEF